MTVECLILSTKLTDSGDAEMLIRSTFSSIMDVNVYSFTFIDSGCKCLFYHLLYRQWIKCLILLHSLINNDECLFPSTFTTVMEQAIPSTLHEQADVNVYSIHRLIDSGCKTFIPSYPFLIRWM
ncbi:hypothetical protein AVEN_165916-1 [Araneus ventricosus]|uniref:Uncharacterized protein n=1 Tax=Araneus ventricosus TaxID=182803 RepID=A0A4Y2PXX8_ARAVE|nr:hypothetical protein AVEN_165916-1 [Araneus ventricosus]